MYIFIWNSINFLFQSYDRYIIFFINMVQWLQEVLARHYIYYNIQILISQV